MRIPKGEYLLAVSSNLIQFYELPEGARFQPDVVLNVDYEIKSMSLCGRVYNDFRLIDNKLETRDVS